MRVMVNGEVVEAGDDADLAALLEQLGLTKRLVVVELNGQPVARSAVASTSLRDGDRLEVVRAVAGG